MFMGSREIMGRHFSLPPQSGLISRAAAKDCRSMAQRELVLCDGLLMSCKGVMKSLAEFGHRPGVNSAAAGRKGNCLMCLRPCTPEMSAGHTKEPEVSGRDTRRTPWGILPRFGKFSLIWAWRYKRILHALGTNTSNDPQISRRVFDGRSKQRQSLLLQLTTPLGVVTFTWSTPKIMK